MALAAWVPPLIGSLAAVCTTAAFVPQVVRVWRLRSASAISLVTFSVFAVGTAGWLVYGLLIASAPVVVANGVTLGLALTLVALKVRFDATARPRGPLGDRGVPPA